MLTEQTASQIEEYLLREGRRYIDENLASVDGTQLKPFHARLMPTPFVVWSTLSERSFSTRSGSWFQETARLVALEYHEAAEKNFPITGDLRPAAEAHIDALLEEMDRGHPRRTPNRVSDLSEVLGVQGKGGIPRSTISDLYVRRADGVHLYFEMKTPQPNKDTSRAMKRQILLISALGYEGRVEAYASCAYNPYGDGSPYTWGYASQFLQIHADMLIGRSFWEKIGEESTYEELLTICESVGVKLDAYLTERSEQHVEEEGGNATKGSST